MELVDYLRELLGLVGGGGGGVEVARGLRDRDLFFEDPHLDFGVEEGGVRDYVFGDQFGHCGAPVAGPDDGHFVFFEGAEGCHGSGWSGSLDYAVWVLERCFDRFDEGNGRGIEEAG